MPLAHLGPDARVVSLCGTNARVAVASVNELGSGMTQWSLSLAGDVAFSLEQSVFQTCQATGASVAFVTFKPPLGAIPGDAFSTVATIRADRDAFPAGMVAVHAQVVAPSVSAERTTVDFGDVQPGGMFFQTLRLRNEGGQPLAFYPSFSEQDPFAIMPSSRSPSVSEWQIAFGPAAAGDYFTTVDFTATPMVGVSLPAGCVWKQTITLQARAVDGADGGADASASPDGP
jgi:hypothetical protein